MRSRTRPECASPTCRSRPSGSLWRSRPRLEVLAPEGAEELAEGGGLEAEPEFLIARQEVSAGGGQAHPTARTAAGHPLDEFDAGCPRPRPSFGPLPNTTHTRIFGSTICESTPRRGRSAHEGDGRHAVRRRSGLRQELALREGRDVRRPPRLG